MIITISTKTIDDLSKKEKDGLWEIEHTKNYLVEQINELHRMSVTISADIEAQPEISFFQLVERNNLKMFETILPKTEYSLSDFQPGNLRRAIQDKFGSQPMLLRSGHKSYVSKFVVHSKRHSFIKLHTLCFLKKLYKVYIYLLQYDVEGADESSRCYSFQEADRKKYTPDEMKRRGITLRFLIKTQILT